MKLSLRMHSKEKKKEKLKYICNENENHNKIPAIIQINKGYSLYINELSEF